MKKKFVLVATINCEIPDKIQTKLIELVGVDAILRTDEGFRIKTALEGQSARELNRLLLSALRSIDRKTTLRGEWTSDGITERFFDYVPKGVRKA
jgi:hypothetical protein